MEARRRFTLISVIAMPAEALFHSDSGILQPYGESTASRATCGDADGDDGFLPSWMGAIHESTTPSPFPSAHTDTLQESVQCAAKVTVRIHAASRGYAKDTVSRPLKIAEHLLPFFSLASLRSMRRSFRTSVGSNGTDAARAAAARRRLLSRIPPPSFLLPSYIVYTAAPFQKGSIDREQSISLSLPARRLRVELLHPL